MMTWRRLLLAICLVALVSARAVMAATGGEDGGSEPVDRPDVVILYVDDMGWADVGCFGGTRAPTPNIDSLCAEGARLDALYVAAPVCTPSRAALLTGRLPVRYGLADKSNNFRNIFSPAIPAGLPREEQTVAEVLRDRAGYQTALVGKWHLGISDGRAGDGTGAPNYGLLPRHQGFDEYYGMPVTNVMTCGGKTIFPHANLAVYFFTKSWHVWGAAVGALVGLRMGGLIGRQTVARSALALVVAYLAGLYYSGAYTLLNPASCMLMRGEAIVEQPVRLANLTARLTAEAVSYVGRATATPDPYLLYMAFHKTHTALFSSPHFEGAADTEYGDNLAELDWAVGQILGAIDRGGRASNTLILFASDNGGWVERGADGGSNGPFRGGKAQIYEGGIRVPGIIRWPARLSGPRNITAPVSTLDLMPTLLEVLRLSQPPADGPLALDGKSIAGLLSDNAPAGLDASPHDFLFQYCGTAVHAVRHGRHKVLYATPIVDEGTEGCFETFGCGCEDKDVVHHNPPLVIDLVADPGERSPLDPRDPVHAAVAEAVAAAVAAHRASLPAPLPAPQVPSVPRPWLFPCAAWPACYAREDWTAIYRDVIDTYFGSMTF